SSAFAPPSWKPPASMRESLPAQPLALRLDELRRQLAELNESSSAAFFELGDFGRLLKSTVSLCPDCLCHVPALVFTRDSRVLMRKRCECHGFSEALLENDEAFYHLSNKDRW